MSLSRFYQALLTKESYGDLMAVPKFAVLCATVFSLFKGTIPITNILTINAGPMSQILLRLVIFFRFIEIERFCSDRLVHNDSRRKAFAHDIYGLRILLVVNDVTKTTF